MDRRLRWPDCVNVRDLGGLLTTQGQQTQWRAIVRSDGLDRLSDEGWRALESYGIRTIVDLRNDVERDAEGYRCDLDVLHVPIEDDTDVDFIARWRPFSTPHYYLAALDRWPQRLGAAVAAVARAGPGGIVVHCGAGRDRTGLLVMLLLAVASVASDEIADDYELSARCLPPLDVDRLLQTPSKVNPRSRADLEADLDIERRRRTAMSEREALLTVLHSLDVRAYLLAAGLNDEEIGNVERRLIERQ